MNNRISMDLEEPEKIYDLIIKSIKDIELELNGETGDIRLNNAKQQVLKIIRDVRTIEIEKSIEELKKNQEWDTFTIAFYGETNSGKSTIIESLRIYFQEEEKVKTQIKFDEMQIEHESQIENLEKEFLKLKLGIDEYQTKYTTTVSDFDSQKEEIEKQIFDMNKIDTEKRKNSFWYRTLSYLNLNSLAKDIHQLEIKLDKEELRVQDTLKNINLSKGVEEEKLKSLQNKLNQLHGSTMKKLDDLSDGKIIGDGRSDFTQKTTKYFFKSNEQEFMILDVPGIEGNESDVIDEIGSALRNAHAVFYVTSNPMPPQKGNDDKKGTLEKVKEHLGNQTEVYTIFNKRITNPMQLEKPLVSNEEKLSLDVLNDKMREIIGENYIDNQSLTAKVSFLALAKSLLQNSKTIDEKNKFLNKFTTDDLLEKSAFTDFTNFLSNNLIENTQLKIKKSNFTKVNNVLNKLIYVLSQSSKNNFEPLYKELSQEVKDVSHNLDNILRATKNRMKSTVKKETRKFANETRSKIYKYINNNVSDKAFKSKLESEINIGYENLTSIIPIYLEKERKRFQDEMNGIIENFIRRANAVIQEFNTIDFDTEENDYEIKINLDNGIDSLGLGSSILGAGMLAYTAIMFGNSWNPFGWIMFAVGVVTVLIGFTKSIRKLFSDDYKKSQQRDSASENIDRISKKISESIFEELDKSFSEFEERIDLIVNALKGGPEQIKQANDCLIDSRDILITLSKKIQIEGEKSGTDIKQI